MQVQDFQDYLNTVLIPKLVAEVEFDVFVDTLKQLVKTCV